MSSARMFGETQEITLEQGVVRYREQGTGPVLVFVHGIVANGTLWRGVVPRLSEQFRCVVPDLPLGGHSVPLAPDADVSPPGVARIVADLLEALELRDVTLVGNDTGGAICQITISRHPERISRLVLTNCDAYESFFPLLVSPFHYGAWFLGRHFVDSLAWLLRVRFFQRLFLGALTSREMDAVTLDAYFTPLLDNAEVRGDLTQFLSKVSSRHTLDTARSFKTFNRPVLIAWGENDLFFSSKLARRLQQDFPDATLQFVPDSRAFIPEDRPEQLAGLIRDFVQTHQSGGEG